MVKEKRFTKFKFDWPDDYGAFSFSQSALDHVIVYIQNQKEHHKKKPFKQEYIGFLKKFKFNTMKSIY